MKTTAEIGMKVTAAQREYCRYTGLSAAMERRGLGSSRLDDAWKTRWPSPPDHLETERSFERSSASDR